MKCGATQPDFVFVPSASLLKFEGRIEKVLIVLTAISPAQITLILTLAMILIIRCKYPRRIDASTLPFVLGRSVCNPISGSRTRRKDLAAAAWFPATVNDGGGGISDGRGRRVAASDGGVTRARWKNW